MWIGLRYLCIITKDLSDPAWEEYNRLLKKAEREQTKSNEKSGFVAGELPTVSAGGAEEAAGELKMGAVKAGNVDSTPSPSPMGSREGSRPPMPMQREPADEYVSRHPLLTMLDSALLCSTYLMGCCGCLLL
jgi:hypothetical protein